MGHHAGDIDNGARHSTVDHAPGHDLEAKTGDGLSPLHPTWAMSVLSHSLPSPHLGHLEHRAQVHTEGPGETADN